MKKKIIYDYKHKFQWFLIWQNYLLQFVFLNGNFLKKIREKSIFSKKSIPKQLMVVKKYKKNTFPQLKQMTWSVKNSRIVKVRSFQAFIKVMTTTVFSNGSKHFMTLPLVGTNDQGLSKISQPKCNKSLEKYK